MAEELIFLKEDGYLNVDSEIKQIVYHPSLNVILICTGEGIVRVLDVNSGVVLQNSNLSAQNGNEIACQYIPELDRVLFCDGQALGVRSDYNGVLLLDTILQKPTCKPKDSVKLELLLSEAIILKQSLTSAAVTGIDDILNELTEKISEAQECLKIGIKAQKWTTLCLELPLEAFRSATNATVTELIVKNQRTPELGVASAVYERLSELLGEQANASDRRAMASEAKRRETFTNWPHMDYKWALPDQMAQAGFYHQPNVSGKDRAMCFTCTVCLVCWERTDEPWSEHERHSPNCPFVLSEYTENVPLSVTYATSPAADVTHSYRNMVPVNVLGTSSVPHLFATSNSEGLISVYDVTGKVKRTHSFFVTQFDSHVLEKLTQDFGVPSTWCDNNEIKHPAEKQVTALTIVGEKAGAKTTPQHSTTSTIRPSIICGLNVRFSAKSQTCVEEDMEVMVEHHQQVSENGRLYFVVYDFQYVKEPLEVTNTLDGSSKYDATDARVNSKDFIMLEEAENLLLPTTNNNTGGSDIITFISDFKPYNIVKEQVLYQNLIPGESDEIFLPPSTDNIKHSGPRLVDTSASAFDALQYPMSSSPIEKTNSVTDKTISDHIADLKSNRVNKKLNYSRAVQCMSIPENYKCAGDAIASHIVPTDDGRHVLVVVQSPSGTSNGLLLMYALDFSGKMVKVVEQPIMARELSSNENPVEVRLLPQLDRIAKDFSETEVSGTVIAVCSDGSIQLIDLSTLKTVSVAKMDGEKFMSAVYCTSLERLCASTKKGSLHFYALKDNDSDSIEDHDDEDMLGLSIDSQLAGSHPTESSSGSEMPYYFHESVGDIKLEDLRRLQSLCLFEPIKVGYCAVVPPCWSEMQQAQRQRRHPHIQTENEQHTKTWRLQTDTTTWDEHVFELTLPSPTCVGHVDVHFALHGSSVLPHVEITLLKQNTNSIGHRKNVKFGVDDAITFEALQWANNNPVTSQEYLRAHKADILAGPVDIATSLDLTDQGGCVTLTSPRLFKSRVRTLLLHIKSVFVKEEGGTRFANATRSRRVASGVSAAAGGSSLSSNKGEFYMGCDCLQEVSVTVYTVKHVDISNEKMQRSAMLESNVFVQSLVTIVTAGGSYRDRQSRAMDILNWIAAIRMTRNRSCNGEPPNQQIEFLKIVETNLPGLLRQCLLLANRSISHKCAKLMIICSNGARNMNEQIGKRFDSCILSVLLVILESIDRVQSASSLQWIVNLLFKVAQPDQCAHITSKCVSLLSKLSEEIHARTNPYHLLLRSRYGLYGIPLEPELFDIEPPPSVKATSVAVTYASVVAGDTSAIPSTDFHTNFTCNKETLDPKEVLSVSKGDNKIKLKNVASTKMIRGLLETEPLHFTCVSASEGTRLERADSNGNNFVNSIIPIPVSGTQPSVNSGTKKVEVETFMSEPEAIYVHNPGKEASNGQGSSNNSNASFFDGFCNMILYTDNLKTDEFSKIKMITDTTWEISVDSDSSSINSETNKPVFGVDQILSPPQTLPWQQLLITPPQQVIIVERMHSGARRFVTLDFGQMVLLTDILIPACHDLVSLSVDVWVKSEDVDAVRLVVASDINTKNLILSDLQPQPLCRYLKITAVGRYGMSTTRCRIPIGSFFGHLVTTHLTNKEHEECQKSTCTELENQLGVLSMLLEDVGCRYSLASTKLKNFLQPFLNSNVSNASHFATYMSIMKENEPGSCTLGGGEVSKIITAYQEAVTYQRQLNTVRSVMRRIEDMLHPVNNPLTNVKSLNHVVSDDKSDASQPALKLSSTSTDKLCCIVEALLDSLLSIDSTAEINLDTCQKLFSGLCVAQNSRIQLLGATLLLRSCGKQPFWDSFIADTLKNMFSSSCTYVFPQDRLFVLLAFLGRKSPDRSSVVDATLRVIAEVLVPLAENRQNLLAVSIDCPLLGWLLLFLSLLLDMNKGMLPNATRWDWVTGEIAGKTNDTSGSSYKKKLQKTYLYKQQLKNLDWTQKVCHTSTQALSALSSQAAHLTSKLEAALKQQEHIFKKMKHYKVLKDASKSLTDSDNNGSSKQTKRRREPSQPQENKQWSSLPSQQLDCIHCLVVAKCLISLLLSVDHSCSADMFLLSCKVIARLISLARLRLGQLMNEDHLLKLVKICIGSELPWAPHALACLLQDALEVTKPTSSETDMETDNPSTNAWTPSDLITDVESLCESFIFDDGFIFEPASKQGKTTNNNENTSSANSNVNNVTANPNNGSNSAGASGNNNAGGSQLTYVYESDDSELEDFLDDILERGRNLLKRSSKSSHPSLATSSAMDARLEHNVEMSAEIALRQLTIATTCNLVQNVSASVPQGELQKETTVWPTRLTTPWQIHPQSSATNRYLLISCFNSLFRDLHSQSPANMENVLQLWLTLNCVRPDDKFDPSVMPFVGLSGDAVNALVSAIAWSPGLSLRTWCSALQTLTLVCNMTHNETGTSPNQWSDPYGLYAMTQCIVGHPDFTQMLLRLLSGSGLVFSEKGLAGPSLCKTLHDFLVRLQMRCNVVSPSSHPGSNLKSLLLKIVYQLIQPNGPLAARQGPLDAQCKLLQSMGYLDYSNADLSIAMSIFESTGILAHSYISHVERIRCVNIGERLNPTSHLFSGILASVLGSESNKQDRPVSWDFLLISLLKLQAKLVQTPLPGTNEQSEAMDTEPVVTSQTDESKAEQIQQEKSGPTVPCLADTVLQHHPSIIRLCQCLAACKASSLSMLANISQQSAFTDLGEPGTVGDAVFHVLAALAKKASNKELVLEPVLMFLVQAPQLSEPLLWFILQVIDTEDALRSFLNSGGIRILAQSLVQSSNAPNTISHTGTISAVMQHFGSTTRSDASTAIAAASATKKLQQATLENTMSLVNFAPFGTIKCQSGTAQSADVLIQGGAAAHRRARTPQWSYHFYPEEIHTELLIQLPSAILLREVHLQPHLSSLATCPSAVALEVSSDGPSRLVPACPPLPTSGMTFIRFHLPVPEVVNCIQLCLYKPRDANNIGLSQIRILGTSAFGGHFKQLQQIDLSDDESHCKYSLGWLRLLHHCFTLASDSNLKRQVVTSAVEVPNLLSVCCGLLIMPTNIPILYLPNLESVLCEMSLHDRENGLNVIRILLNSKPNGNEVFTGVNWGRGVMLVNSAGVQSACELLNQICGHQDSETAFRVALLLEWVKSVCEQAIATTKTDVCNAAYLSSIASILWTTYQSRTSYNITSLITLNLFDSLYNLLAVVQGSTPLKYALDSLLCSLCYIKLELFPTLLQRMGVLIPNLSTDHGASISDDRKDSESMTDDTKQTFECDSEWYGRLIIGDLSTLNLTESQLETIALVSRSPTTIQQLLDSGLPKLLNTAILQFCSSSYNFAYPMARLENVATILKFFADVSEEKIMRDWLGSKDGSSFWLPLLQWLCRTAQSKKSNVKSETLTQLEEICIRFLSKCSICHPNNQAHLAKILCEVIAQQTNGISGFMRRLILQLLLENEKVPVTIKADETIYRNTYYYTPVHPAFKQTHNQAFLYLGTNITLAEILEQHVSFSTLVDTDVLGGTNGNKRDSTGGKCETSKGWWHMVDSDLSMAAGVTAKDKRAKDAKNQATATPQLKKKRYTNADIATHPNVFEGRIIRCEALPERALPVNMTLGQVLRLIETKGVKTDWPCVRLIIAKSTGNEDKNNKNENNPIVCQSSYSSTLQVFSSVGGLALLAQHLPAIYPESIRTTNTKKQIVEQSESDWVKLEGSDDIYEDIEETASSSTPSKTTNVVSNVPTHSLTAFGLFLRLPGYAEVLLKDLKKALCLLRLVLGVTDDGEGGDIFQSPIADSLPTLPFEVLRKLYDATPLSTDDGRLLRRISISAGVVHLLLACLGIFTHQTQNIVDKDGNKEKLKEEKSSQLYWAKGTGYGTGSTQQSWNVEQALLKQRSEEEHVTVLLQVLASYINPNGEADDELSDNVLPPAFYQLLANSALIPALSSYLRNDSVLDMARHIPLYKAALQLLRALAASSQLVSLLLPQKNQNNGPSVSMLLKNMKTCVDTYASKLKTAETHKTSKKFNGKSSSGKYKSKMGEQLEELERDEGLAQLMPDIQATANLVTAVTDRLIDSDNELMDTKIEQPLSASIEERYLSIMKKLQFDTFEMIQEIPEGGYKFIVSHHFESNARSAGDQSHPARVKRLAQEAVTLATSLPLSYSSSVFVRCDTDRLDIMKVLITGPADTPYANGCLELDVYFPPDYPLAPMMINLETTGHHTVRFNPNLYNDGKVCLSVLNTWHGRPEEKWNPQTSSFLQVLVSIQSLILVPEPYFNEPGYERSRGTPAGTQSSREYNQNVYQATVRWAMLEQIVNPCPCFRDVIHAHFYLKRDEVIAQVEEWIKDMENSSNEKKSCRNNNKRTVMNTLDSFKKTFEQLKEKLMQLEPPDGLTEDVRRASSTEMATSDSSEAVNTKEEDEEEEEEETSQEHYHQQQQHQDAVEQNEIFGDIDMEKMVNEMCE